MIHLIFEQCYFCNFLLIYISIYKINDVSQVFSYIFKMLSLHVESCPVVILTYKWEDSFIMLKHALSVLSLLYVYTALVQRWIKKLFTYI